ncbi:MAG: methionyl-tRNA formyltransferase [Oscillospiraceae bacterium]|nr:methionyl-tRNA formyltransferase [Oscillospiraceae bacterium]
MNIIFMGTPDFAAASLKALIDAKYNVVAAFTQPDKPVGRKRIMTPPPVKVLAEQNNIPVYQPETLRDGAAEEIIKGLKPDLMAVVAYGKIIPESILNLAPLGCINVHGSLLPALRGAAPIQWSVINGEKYAGVTTMFMDKGLDTGDIILKEKTEILPLETSGELYERLAPMGAELLVKTIELIKEGKAPREKQNDNESTYAPMLNKELAVIDFSKTKKEICSLVCGLNPWPIALTSLEGKRLKVYRAAPCDKKGEIGALLDEKKFIIGCADGSVELLEVQIEGSKAQNGEEFLRGKRLSLNTKFE